MDFSSNKDKTKSASHSGLLFDLAPLKGKTVSVSFTGSDISSDGGLLLLRECDHQIGIIDGISKCLNDDRHPSYVRHSFKELLTQRVFQIAAGYEDADDCDSLRGDDILKICSGKLPGGADLASQPTMSRFENAVGNKELYGIAEAFLNHFIRSYDQEPPVIILDADDTNSTTYGGQQLSVFNDYYGDYCLMPLHIYEGHSGKLITTILKPGSRSKSVNVFGILRRIVQRLRRVWKHTTIIIRGDSHFCSHQLMDWCVQQKDNVHFLTGLTGNIALNRLAATIIKTTQSHYQQNQKPVKRYHSFEYKAGSWTNFQRVIVKVEVSAKGTNVRYVVTDIRNVRTQQLYENGYCARGAMELRIKEHKLYLKSDRMSCTKFKANQLRLFLHSAAYVLLHTLQTQMLQGTEYATATFKTIREKIIKVAAYVREIKTTIKIEFPASCPQKSVISKCLGLFEAIRT
jgi:hypothetical protein